MLSPSATRRLSGSVSVSAMKLKYRYLLYAGLVLLVLFAGGSLEGPVLRDDIRLSWQLVGLIVLFVTITLIELRHVVGSAEAVLPSAILFCVGAVFVGTGIALHLVLPPIGHQGVPMSGMGTMREYLLLGDMSGGKPLIMGYSFIAVAIVLFVCGVIQGVVANKPLEPTPKDGAAHRRRSGDTWEEPDP